MRESRTRESRMMGPTSFRWVLARRIGFLWSRKRRRVMEMGAMKESPQKQVNQ